MMGHGHDHGSGVHGPANFDSAFAVAIVLNLLFVMVEATFGLLTDSMALLADAGHNLSDVLGLVIAWAGAFLARRPPSRRFTYGLRGSTILAALLNALLLLVAVGAIAWEAIERLGAPQPVPGKVMMAVAGVGIVVNGLTALLFARGRNSDINIRGAFLHMTADAAVSGGVVIAGLLILYTGADWIDPAVSLAIVAVIVAGTWGLLRESIRMSLDAVPASIDIAEVEEDLGSLPGVSRVHDLHVWPLSTTETALTAHLVMPAGHPGDAFLHRLQDRMHSHFGIQHSTIQIELADEGSCSKEELAGNGTR
jgi:cobalt-zinc-cadmium efflux system protein